MKKEHRDLFLDVINPTYNLTGERNINHTIYEILSEEELKKKPENIITTEVWVFSDFGKLCADLEEKYLELDIIYAYNEINSIY